MEAAPGVPHSKKRKLEETASSSPPEPPPVLADALHSEPTSHGQEPYPGAGEGGDGIDRISRLPEAVLGEITSLLPTRDALRTQTLASRWRGLWLSSPLNLDHSSLPADDEVQAGLITRILAAHPGPARRFSVRPSDLQDRLAVVAAWLQSPALYNLQELEFCDRRVSPRWWDRKPSLPASTFRFSATLRVLTICQCSILDSTVETFHLPQLKQLSLVCVKISDGSLHGMIDGCPVLESLLLEESHGFSSVRINSRTLISIGISSEEVIIEDAPMLKRLLQLEPVGAQRLSVVSAPKLETLGLTGLGYISKLVFGNTVIQNLSAASCVTALCSVKILAINFDDLCLDLVINLMGCFPCLEKLYIMSSMSGNRNFWRRKHRNLIKGLDIRLKTVVLNGYRGINSQINFATFFVLNAKMLELMRFEGSDSDKDWFISEQRRVLQLEKRASRGAQFCFATSHGCRHYFAHIKNVHDLSITNPFERTSCCRT
ncbi:hypothetical protein ACP70R_041481 [Stipagrostis hirtigluma subsp. patula]